MEAHFHHTYFNRKIFILGNGIIQNSETILLNDSVNLTKDDVGTILGAINSTENQTYWNVRKDDSEACKDCEFRYMCLDNRKPLKQEPSDLWKFDIECDYNPYTSEWKSK